MQEYMNMMLHQMSREEVWFQAQKSEKQEIGLQLKLQIKLHKANVHSHPFYVVTYIHLILISYKLGYFVH